MIQASGSLRQLSKGALKLVTTLHQTFLTRDPPGRVAPDDATRERWHKRYLEALRTFRVAGIAVTSNEEAGLAAYVEMRSRWDAVVMVLAPAMKHDLAQVDPAGQRATSG